MNEFVVMIKMETKKYGVNLSALKSLEEFQRSLLTKKRTFTIPFVGQCLIGIDDKPPVTLPIIANPGILSSPEAFSFHLKDYVETISQTDTEVLFEAKQSSFHFTKIFLKFSTTKQKQHFMSAIENVLSSDSDESTLSSSTTDSGL